MMYPASLHDEVRSSTGNADRIPGPALLVVDDVADIVSEMMTMFGLVGLSAMGAHSIESALARLRQDRGIHLVICDIHLRSEDGRNLLKRLTTDPQLVGRAIEILFMTGDANEKCPLQGMPGVAVLRKPVDPDVLIDCARRMLGMGTAPILKDSGHIL